VPLKRGNRYTQIHMTTHSIGLSSMMNSVLQRNYRGCTRRNWETEDYWHGPRRNRIPLEGHLHRQADTGHPSVVKFLGDHVDRRLRMIRIYTAYGELAICKCFWTTTRECGRWPMRTDAPWMTVLLESRLWRPSVSVRPWPHLCA
jgi:hypothetical protein